ncbi:hypothetical protein AmaxDRAFT_1215 [Limnospira maxima CS-328]|uniref:Uncharacterized protein n=1 Tax=Limnospira maxima CS-328 TaxID=513049 RepID=B5VXH3_LIMMA|nr:hypothetical protein AmaxDRAFT_1215 [Limnospira maxima CS-328]
MSKIVGYGGYMKKPSLLNKKLGGNFQSDFSGREIIILEQTVLFRELQCIRLQFAEIRLHQWFLFR